MSKNSAKSDFVLPGEYRKVAERLFPKSGLFGGNKVVKPDFKAAAEFAAALGTASEYQRIINLEKDTEEMQTFLKHFKTNLDLLIQKTWVDKTDERRKDALHNDTASFMTKLDKGDYLGAIEDFGVILEELAYLFFGKQSKQEDFTEYTFRIDAQMGLFWWYGSKLSLIKESVNDSNGKYDKFLWAILLLGICYLTNF